jgi:vacuolar-type H+-ATPase subunit F/Vma7
MSTPHVTVIVPAELADGYRLAGVHTEQAETVTAAGEALEQLIGGTGQPGVVAVYPPYLRELGGRWQRRISQLDSTLVLPLPEGQAHGAPEPAGESLRDLLARAVGYEFTFDPMGGSR